METSKVEKVRKIMTIFTMALAFMTICLCIVGLQVKKICLNYYGTNIEVKTLASNVQSFLLSNNIYVDSNTSVYPAFNESIKSGDVIILTDTSNAKKMDVDAMLASYKPVTAKVVEEEIDINYKEEYIENASMYRGVSVIKEDGKNGKKKIKYILKTGENKAEEKIILSEDIIEQAKNKVVEVGTSSIFSTSRSSGVVIPAVDSGFKVYNIPLSSDMQQYTYAICQKYGIQYELLLAVMYVESRFSIYEVGGNNSYGLCQIHYSNTSLLRNAIGITDLLDPYDNIEAGAYMLKTYLDLGKKRSSDQYFIEHYGLNCYNMGEGVFVSNCYSKGILERTYSNKVRGIRDTIIANGGI